VGHIDVVQIKHTLPNGRVLLDDVSFRVGEGATVALVGANGAGKTTLLRLIAGDERPQVGTIGRSGGLGVMRQFIGSVQDDTTVRDLLLSVSPAPVQAAGRLVDDAELAMMSTDDEPTQGLGRRRWL
jgi:ATPase subunit of ABC transporter with duplicated ATPase domains